MTSIDEIGRRAGRAARADAEAIADVEGGLARLFAGDVAEQAPRAPQRWPLLAGAAITAAAAVALAVVVVDDDDQGQPLVPATEPVSSPSPSTAVGPTTTAVPPTSATPTTTAAPTTTPTPTTNAVAPSGLAVSYLDPPPALVPEVFATIASGGDRSSITVSPSGAAIRLDPDAGLIEVVEPDGSTRAVTLRGDVPDVLVAAGPHDVVYGLRYGELADPQTTGSILAIALSGDTAGTVVATAAVDSSAYVEMGFGWFGNGPGGVIERVRLGGGQVIGYVDEQGNQVGWPGTPPPLLTLDESNTVRSSDGRSWSLQIERHPDWLGETYVGEHPPVPGPDGGAILLTTIGPPADDDVDHPPPTVRVIAVLAPDGSARWYQVPDEWGVVASDVGGTILGRDVGGQLELARLPAGAPTPDEPVAGLADAIGANELIIRRSGAVAVYRNGQASDVATPPDAHVQTDGEFLWWSTDASGESPRTVATSLDGTVVCEVDGVLHRVRQDPDGGYIASVEQFAAVTGALETPVPNFAVDCETGAAQPIEPVTWLREGGGRFVIREAGRTFTGEGDSEGNAAVTNEAGVRIDGDDYAGYHAFDADAGRVAYLALDAGIGPHASPLLRARDTTTGAELWSVDLVREASGLWWYGNRVLAAIRSPGLGAMEAVMVIDGATGEIITTVPTALEIIHAG